MQGDLRISQIAFTADGGQVYSGMYSLQLTDNAPSGTPQAFAAALWNLQDGDVITAGFWRYDDTPASAPSCRIWGHWNDDLPADINGYSGSASERAIPRRERKYSRW